MSVSKGQRGEGKAGSDDRAIEGRDQNGSVKKQHDERGGELATED